MTESAYPTPSQHAEPTSPASQAPSGSEAYPPQVIDRPISDLSAVNEPVCQPMLKSLLTQSVIEIRLIRQWLFLIFSVQ